MDNDSIYKEQGINDSEYKAQKAGKEAELSTTLKGIKEENSMDGELTRSNPAYKK